MLRVGTLMDRTQLRELLVALVSRADVNRSHLRLLICCYELDRFLAWDGHGMFKRATIRPKGSDRFRMLYAPANLICTRPEYLVPVRACVVQDAVPDGGLVSMLKEASELHEFMLRNRDRSIPQLAKEKNMGSKTFARFLRLNYLAPDIQAAIVDGTQPADLSRHKILFGPQPLDWDHQRRLYGFA